MRRRPVCILCMLLVVFLCVTDWLGFSLIRGNPLPQSVQTWIRKHPESTICGNVEFQALKYAPEAQHGEIRKYNLSNQGGANLGMICGGEVEVLYELL